MVFTVVALSLDWLSQNEIMTFQFMNSHLCVCAIVYLWIPQQQYIRPFIVLWEAHSARGGNVQALSTALLLLIQYSRTGFYGGNFNNCQTCKIRIQYTGYHCLVCWLVTIRKPFWLESAIFYTNMSVQLQFAFKSENAMYLLCNQHQSMCLLCNSMFHFLWANTITWPGHLTGMFQVQIRVD